MERAETSFSSRSEYRLASDSEGHISEENKMEPVSEIHIPLSRKITRDNCQQIDLFRARFKILWENWESLKEQGLRLGGMFSLDNRGKKQFSGNSSGVDPFRLKGFYVDFRFFCAEREPTFIFKIANILANHCSDKRLHRELSYNRKGWTNAFVFQPLLGLTADQMLAYWFKGEIFHNDKNHRKGVVETLEIMNSDIAHHILMLALRDRLVAIGNLYWMLEPLSYECQKVRIHSIDHPLGQRIHG